MKNLHAVALGRLGGAKGGPARAAALSAGKRRAIARAAALARAAGLTSLRRSEIARTAARARWSAGTATAAPESVRRLLKTYAPAQLRWSTPNDRYAIVRAILLNGEAEARSWLRSKMTDTEVRELVRSYGGAGCNEPERARLRATLRLTTDDIPRRDYLGF
jgi:hypothetical protein